MMNTWLMRRSVRRPVSLATTALSVQAALHEQLGLALADQLHGLRSRGVAVRCIDDLGFSEGDPAPLGHLLDLGGRQASRAPVRASAE
jgi:hypothetical protein